VGSTIVNSSSCCLDMTVEVKKRFQKGRREKREKIEIQFHQDKNFLKKKKVIEMES